MQKTSGQYSAYKGPKSPEFVEELGAVVDKIFSLDDYSPTDFKKLILKHKRRKSVIKELIEASGIEPKKPISGRLTPRQYGAKLVNEALTDASSIYLYANKAMPRSASNVDRSKMLKSNAVELLRPASLSDGDKIIILDSEAKFKYKKPIVMEGTPPEGQLLWIPPIGDMMQDRMNYYKANGRSVGCPAVQASVVTPEGRDSLIHNFWDRFVDTMLELPRDPQVSFAEQPAICPYQQVA